MGLLFVQIERGDAALRGDKDWDHEKSHVTRFASVSDTSGPGGLSTKRSTYQHKFLWDRLVVAVV